MSQNFFDGFEERKGGFSLYTGVVKMNVVGINPTRKQLASLLGIEEAQIKKEPSYDGRLEFRVEIPMNETNPIKTKVTFFISNDPVTGSRSGKQKFINKHGEVAWHFSVDELKNDSKYDWYQKEGLRACREGEEELYAFCLSWCNADTSKFNFEIPWESIVSGDLTFFHQMIERFGDRSVLGLMGVREGKYQDIYRYKFGHQALTSLKRFENVDNWPGTEWSVDFQAYSGSAEPTELESEMEEDEHKSDLPF